MSDKKRFQIPRFYKTILALSVVIGPFAWLMFTEDGKRRTDLMILGFKDLPMVEMRLDTLAEVFGEAQIREFLPDVHWQCAGSGNEFSDQRCSTQIAAFNDTPATRLVMLYAGDKLAEMEVVYRASYHQHMTTTLDGMLGKAQQKQGISEWPTDHGLILMQNQKPTQDTSSMLWLSRQRAMARLNRS